jgi:hypothetical protein
MIIFSGAVLFRWAEIVEGAVDIRVAMSFDGTRVRYLEGKEPGGKSHHILCQR